tara:strand:+ start:220 stop:1281 length:1062 start_codon:yes stop_codon:yes gene_type:complete
MPSAYKILILGASYGSLLGAKIALAGHDVKLVCLPEEVDLINSAGAKVRMAARGVEGLVELNTKDMPGHLSADGPRDVNPEDYDLIGLAMQEPQYGVPELKDLMNRIAKSGVPCMSIMNMPPLAYLRRIQSIDSAGIRDSYTDPSVWDNFDPALITLCSPDPQAFRPPEEKVNVLQVGLPTNFKAARFDSDVHTDILRNLEAGIQSIRFNVSGEQVELPVKLRVHDSVFTPLAKWSMLMAGNYRCVQESGMRPIKEAVHSDLSASESVYEWVIDLCEKLGGERGDLVPFEKYANAALSLVNPSSAARALANGAPNIERVDKLVQSLASQHGMQSNVVDETVSVVDGWLRKNRS